MYDPTVGRFLSEDPLGLAVDENPYRYVNNSPTNFTDPMGLAPDNPSDTPSIGAIPSFQPGGALPTWEEIKAAPNSNSRTCANYSAQMMIRANIRYLKQDLVTSIHTMLTRTPPSVMPGVPAATKQVLIEASNDLADIYIRAVDKFLQDHPGAKPALGQRSWLGDATGFSNEFNSPWCADWASSMTRELQIGISKGGMNHIFRVQHGQYKPGRDEHNFAVVHPYGYKPAWGTADPNILRFDPWPNLLPGAYIPTNTRLGYPTTDLKKP